MSGVSNKLAFCVIILLITASPGLLLYAFFSPEWLIEHIGKNTTNHTDNTYGNKNLYNATTPTPSEAKVSHGLFKRCNQEGCTAKVFSEAAFALEVTSVTFQFLTILAVPWLKCCFPNIKYLKYWNYCLLPFVVLAAIMCLAGNAVFYNQDETDKTMTFGIALVCACLAGGSQITVAICVGAAFWNRFRRPKLPTDIIAVRSMPEPRSPRQRAFRSFSGFTIILIRIFVFDSNDTYTSETEVVVRKIVSFQTRVNKEVST